MVDPRTHIPGVNDSGKVPPSLPWKPYETDIRRPGGSVAILSKEGVGEHRMLYYNQTFLEKLIFSSSCGSGILLLLMLGKFI
jgi:hypothetical protein